MMIYLELFLGFLQVGCFSFGGAYAAIPLIRDVVIAYGWLDDEALSYMIAISESTPGPIMVNLATYVGSSQGGLLGAFLATFAVIFPAFVIILLILVRILKPCVIGIILATGLNMSIGYVFYRSGEMALLQLKPLLITALLAALWFPVKYLAKKKFSPLTLIAIAACLGVLVYGL